MAFKGRDLFDTCQSKIMGAIVKSSIIVRKIGGAKQVCWVEESMFARVNFQKLDFFYLVMFPICMYDLSSLPKYERNSPVSII